MQSVSKVIFATIIVAVIAGGATLFLIGAPNDWKGSWYDFHGSLSLTSAAAALFLGAALLFAMSFSSYKTKVRRAYMAILASIVLTAIGTIQLPIANGFSLWNTPWVASGGLAIPFIVAGLMAYLGTRSFARTVGTETRLTKLPVVLPGVVVLVCLSSLLPHVTLLPSQSELSYKIANGVLVWSMLLYFVAGVVLLRVRRHIGGHYVTAMTWSSLGFFATALIIAMLFVDGLFTTATQDVVTNTSNVLILMTGLLFMRAGYEFYKTIDY
jgi:hypothetical protein